MRCSWWHDSTPQCACMLLRFLFINKNSRLCISLILWPLSIFKNYFSWTRQAIYGWRNTVARSHNHSSRGKAKRVTYYKRVSVVLVVRHAKRMRVLCCHPWLACLCRTFLIILQTSRFSEESCYHKKCVLGFSTTFAWNISHSKKNSARHYYEHT
jgi:hypothetical protein